MEQPKHTKEDLENLCKTDKIEFLKLVAYYLLKNRKFYKSTVLPIFRNMTIECKYCHKQIHSKKIIERPVAGFIWFGIFIILGIILFKSNLVLAIVLTLISIGGLTFRKTTKFCPECNEKLDTSYTGFSSPKYIFKLK